MFEPGRSRRREDGFTLMELMVTMAIAASLMGLGAGLFLSMGKRTASQNALSGISSLVVNVRNQSSRFPAMLVVDPQAGTVQGMSQEVRQELHFDPRAVPGATEAVVAMGIEGRDCDLVGNHVEPTSGRVGGALRLEGGRVDCGKYAAYDVTDGLTVELWMKLDAVGSAELVTKGDALRVRLESGGNVTATAAVQDERGAEKISASAHVPGITRGKWFGLRVAYDRTELTIAADLGFGWVVRGRKAETRRLQPSPDDGLAVGGFSGYLDDFRFAGVHSAEPITMPTGVKLVGEKPYAIHFLGGRLDTAERLGVERIAIETSGRRTTLEVAENGMLSVAYTDVAVEAGPSEADKPTGPAKKE
jgi:prepilin-type N-terminal cleavage/methylation domain-containing protein